jgi:4'-phosphopantetheinyl transferase
MQTVYWSSKSIGDVPEDQNWLSESEKQFLETLRFPKRRQDWLLGRWTAKYLLQKVHPDCSTEKIVDISILKAKNGAPYISLENENLSGMLSLTHRGKIAVAAWCGHPQIKLGVDLEEIEPKQDNFINDFFTSDEAAQVFALPAEQRAWSASLIWSAKESMLKVLQSGLSMDTRQIAIGRLQGFGTSGWQVIPILRTPNRMKYQALFWRTINSGVLTMAVLSDEIEVGNISLTEI